MWILDAWLLYVAIVLEMTYRAPTIDDDDELRAMAIAEKSPPKTGIPASAPIMHRSPSRALA